MQKINFYFVMVLLLGVSNLFLNYSNAEVTDSTDDLTKSQSKLAIVKLKPEIKSVDNNVEGSNLNIIDISKLNNILKKLIVIDIPNLKEVKKYQNAYLQNINLVKVLNIGNGRYSYILAGINGEKIFSKGTNFLAKGLEEDDRYDYALIKPDASYHHPITGEYLGTGFLKIGTANIIERGKTSILELNSSSELVQIGTLIIGGDSLNLVNNNIRIVKNSNNLKGYILSVIPNKKIAFKNDVLLLSLGTREGVQVGNLFKIADNNIIVKDPYKNDKQYVVSNNLTKGEILIYEVFDKISLGIVIKTNKALNVLDLVTSS